VTEEVCLERTHPCAPAVTEPASTTDGQASRAAAGHLRSASIVSGRLVGFSPCARAPLVVQAESSVALEARTIVDLHAAHVGREVLLAFELGNRHKPIVLGILGPLTSLAPFTSNAGSLEVEADGRRLVVEARNELVLRCGRASVALHADGRIELRGDAIVSTAERANRIRGGSVELN
jgi:Domain of unknown function (DUF6484)